MIGIKQYFAETVHKNEYYNCNFSNLVNLCKSQYKNVEIVENKNVGLM